MHLNTEYIKSVVPNHQPANLVLGPNNATEMALRFLWWREKVKSSKLY